MKFLIIVITIAVSRIIAQTEIPPDQLQQYDSDYSDEVFHENPSAIIPSDSNHRRFNRSVYDESLKSYVNRLKKVARVTNGIYLQQGLISGKIPSDKLIPELLHFGCVTPSQIATMDAKQIEAAIDTLRNIPKNLEADKKTQEVEDVFKGLQEVLQTIDGLGDIREWEKKHEQFYYMIERIYSYGVRIPKEFKLFGNSAVSWRLKYRGLIDYINSENMHYELGQRLYDVMDPMIKMESYRQELENIGLDWINGLQTTTTPDSDNEYVIPETDRERMKKVLEWSPPIVKANEGIDVYIKNYLNIQFEENQEKRYLAYFDSLRIMMKPVKTVQPELNYVKELMASRLTKKLKKLEYLPGFPDVIADITTMFDDLKESWMNDTVKSSEKLSTAMKHLKEFVIPVNKVEKTIGSEEESTAEIQGLFEIINDFTEIVSRTELMKKGVAEGRKCVRVSNTVSYESGIVAESAKGLYEKLTILEMVIVQLDTLAKTPGISKMSNDLIEILKEVETTDNITEVLRKFIQYENRTAVDDYANKLAKLESYIWILDANKDIKEHGTNLVLYRRPYFISDDYSEYFKCLQEQTGLKLVFETIAKLNDIRDKKYDQKYLDELEKGMDVVNKVAGTKDHLMELEKSINKMKGFKSPETDALSLMNDASKHSKTLGSSIQGISNMYNALEHQSNVTKILDYKDLIQSTIANLTEPDDVANLQKLLSVGSEIQEMYSTLDEFKKKVNVSESTILENHSAIFSHATIVKGIDEDFLAISVSVGKLAKMFLDANITSQLEELGNVLKMMDTMGLQFSKYKTHFVNSKKSLAAMDLFFVNYNSKLAPTTLKPPQQEKIMTSNANPEETTEENNNTVLWICIGIGCVLLIGAMMAIYFFWWVPRRLRKKEEAKK